MNPLKSLIALYASIQIELTARFNEALTGRPPLEAQEGGEIARGIIRDLEWGKERLASLADRLETTLTAAATIIPGFDYRKGEAVDVAASRLVDAVETHAAATAISAAISAKTHLPFADHQTALDNAVNTAKDEVKNVLEVEFTAKENTLKILATRRTDLMAKLGTVAAATVKDEDLLAADHEARITAVEARISELAAVGISAEAKPLNFSNLLACSAEEFTSRLEMLKEAGPAVPVAAAAAPPVRPTPSTQAPVLASGQPDKKKPVI